MNAHTDRTDAVQRRTQYDKVCRVIAGLEALPQPLGGYDLEEMKRSVELRDLLTAAMRSASQI